MFGRYIRVVESALPFEEAKAFCQNEGTDIWLFSWPSAAIDELWPQLLQIIKGEKMK